MKKYTFAVQEILEKVVSVVAISEQDAREQIYEKYENEEIILDSRHFNEFNVVFLVEEELNLYMIAFRNSETKMVDYEIREMKAEQFFDFVAEMSVHAEVLPIGKINDDIISFDKGKIKLASFEYVSDLDPIFARKYHFLWEE